MVRHGRAAELDERVVAGGRLAAMGLHPPTQPAGWVPAGAVAPDLRAPDPAVPERRLPDPVARARMPAEAVAPRPDSPSQVTTAPPAMGALARAWAEDRLPPWAPALLDRMRIGTVLTGLALVVSLILVAVLLLRHHSSAGYSSPYDGSATGSSYSSDPVVSTPPSAATAAASIVVDVGGRVRKPGLVTLPAGARVADAIAEAGGPLRPKEIATLDLAARVSDGQLLLIGVTSSASDPGSTSSGDGAGSEGGAPAPVSLSTGTIDDLETLPGVGPVTAQKIIDWRTAHNGFTNVDQLQQVAGIGPTRYAELSPLVTP